MTEPTAIYGEIEAKEQLTRHLVRITFGGPGLDGFAAGDFSDAYFCPLFLRPDTPYDVPFDYESARKLDKEIRPVPRRFTVRRWDADTRKLTADFVCHGDTGVAGLWAQNAQVGDRLQLRGVAAGGYSPAPDAALHLMVGDESALPAIAASLEALPEDSKAAAIVLVQAPGDEIALNSPAAVDVRWLYREDGASDEALAEAVADLDFPDGQVDAFVHGEAGEVRAVRRHLLADRGLDAEAMSCSPYWRRRYTDERWREVKRDWLAEVSQDVVARSAM